jgi:mRNA interferase RelE/StbE
MIYEILFTDTARHHYRELDARWQTAVKEAIRTHLSHEPEKTSKSRIKRLRHLEQPQYRLRVDNLRVFYDIEGSRVVVLGIVPKDGADAWLNQFGTPES